MRCNRRWRSRRNTCRRRAPTGIPPTTRRSSRAARAASRFYAALASLGREGLAALVERHCAQARRFAAGLRAAGFGILNDVVLNQVVVDFGDPDRTRRIIEAIQREGTCWAGVTVWQGRTGMRISVCCWATTDEDVDRSIAAMIECARAVER